MKVRGRFGWVPVLLLLRALPVAALEVDPYLAWLVEIEDSAPALNEYTNAMISGHLEVLAARSADIDACPDVVASILRRLHHSALTRRRAVHFLNSSPDVESWKDGGPWSSVWRSYYRKLPFLYFSSIARTVDINGVRLSVDKIGHLFSYGRKYYRRYSREIERGATPDEAERAAILWGIRQENLFVGKWIDTIFSHADLEANYQGLRLARDLCEGAAPHLVGGDGAWRLVHDVDLRDYITPGFDEGYNTSHFTRLGWFLVRSRLARHCRVLDEPSVARRIAYYRTFPGPSASERIIREVFSSRGKDPQARHSLETLCAGR